MVANILVLLGNENNEEEELADNAKSRAILAVDLLKKHIDYKVIPTGAFGDFNKSNVPHGELLRRFLKSEGIKEDRILQFTRTSNTVQDAYGVLRAIKNLPEVKNIHVITSKFHMNRVKYIFGRAFEGYNITYYQADDAENMKDLTVDEEYKLKRTEKEWVDIANFDLTQNPDKYYTQLGFEFRHYDNFSYFALVGAFLSFGFSCSNFTKPIQIVGSVFVIILFWILYIRLANTASSVRRIMIAIETLYGVPGISWTRTTFPIEFSGFSKCRFVQTMKLWFNYSIVQFVATLLMLILIGGLICHAFTFAEIINVTLAALCFFDIYFL